MRLHVGFVVGSRLCGWGRICGLDFVVGSEVGFVVGGRVYCFVCRINDWSYGLRLGVGFFVCGSICGWK